MERSKMGLSVVSRVLAGTAVERRMGVNVLVGARLSKS